MKIFVRYNHSSLFVRRDSDEESFITMTICGPYTLLPLVTGAYSSKHIFANLEGRLLKLRLYN